MEQEKFDYGIIGAGPAGYTSALLAAQNGKSVVLFEKDRLGGVCLNRGCIPTKTIMHSAQLYKDAKNAEKLGIKADNISVDFAKVMEHKTEVIELLRRTLELVLKSNKITIVPEKATIIDEKIISAGEKKYNCEKIIIATGSNPKELNGIPFDHKFILNSDDLFEMKKLPQKVAIIGAGAEGIEWARIFSAFDTEVTLIEASSRLLPCADEEISKRIARIFKAEKINTRMSTTVKSIENKKITLSNEEILEPDFVLVAIGRTPDKPDFKSRATYLGDVCGSLMLANFAIYQARALVSGINFDKVFIPSVVYGIPEIAWIGAREQDLPPNSYQKNIFPISALGKAHCDNETEGFIKVLSYNGSIIGAHIISKEASAMIHQFAIAMQNDISVDELKKVCFAHPTYSEGVYESVLGL